MKLEELNNIIKECESQKAQAKELILNAKIEAKKIINNANKKQSITWKSYKKEHKIQ